MKPTWAERASQKPEGDIRCAIMRGDLNKLAALFQDTGNPAAAWLCWHLARTWQLPPPENVADEIDRFAGRVADLAIEALDGNARTVIDPDAIAALWDNSPTTSKSGSRRGATGLAEKLRLWERDMEVALRVYELRKSMSEAKACDIAADEFGMGTSNVERVAGGYRRQFLEAESELGSMGNEKPD